MALGMKVVVRVCDQSRVRLQATNECLLERPVFVGRLLKACVFLGLADGGTGSFDVCQRLWHEASSGYAVSLL